MGVGESLSLLLGFVFFSAFGLTSFLTSFLTSSLILSSVSSLMSSLILFLTSFLTSFLTLSLTSSSLLSSSFVSRSFHVSRGSQASKTAVRLVRLLAQRSAPV